MSKLSYGCPAPTRWVVWEPRVEEPSCTRDVRLSRADLRPGARPLLPDYPVRMRSRTLGSVLNALEQKGHTYISAWSYGARVSLGFALQPRPDGRVRRRLRGRDTMRGCEVVLIEGCTADKSLLAQTQAGEKMGEHPCLLRVFDAGRHAGRLRIATELPEGRRLGEMGIFPDRVLCVYCGAAAVLHHACRHGGGHGCLNADSVWIVPDYGIKVGDFEVPAAYAEAKAGDLRSLVEVLIGVFREACAHCAGLSSSPAASSSLVLERLSEAVRTPSR